MKQAFPYEIKTIAPGTYLINEVSTTMFVIEGEKSAVVLDCGVGTGDFRRVVERVTKLPYRLVATHAHPDHVGGRGQFGEICISAVDAPYIARTTTTIRWFFTLINKLTGNMPSLRRVDIRPVEREPVIHTLTEGSLIDLGGRVLEVIATPGHTRGSISLLDPKNRLLFVGDAANDFLFMFLKNRASVDTLVGTLRKLYALEGYDTVWSSHRTEPQTREDIAEYLKGAELLAKKRDGLLPFIAVHNYNGNRIIYKTNSIHRSRP